MNPKWLEWARRLQAIAQNGLTYAQDPFDRYRFEQVRELAAELFTEHSTAGSAAVTDLLANQAGYATPKVDIRGAVFRDNAILLVRERSDGLWTLPGGWVDIHEPPSQAVEREIWEESGYRTKAVKLLALWDRDRHGHPPHAFHVYKIVFLCELIGGEPAHSLETDGVDFFTRDALPPLSLTRVVPAQIARLFAHHDHPGWPADFD